MPSPWNCRILKEHYAYLPGDPPGDLPGEYPLISDAADGEKPGPGVMPPPVPKYTKDAQ